MKKHGENPSAADEDDPAQSKRFVDTARSLETDETGDSFMLAVSFVTVQKPKMKKAETHVKQGKPTKKPAK
jgi:hypothetical protein